MYVTYFCTDAYKSFLDCFFPEDVQYSSLPINGGPPADLLINQGVWDNVSGHTTTPRGRRPAGFELTTKRFQRYVMATRLWHPTTLSKDVLRTMLPDIEINEISLNEGAEVFVIWFSRLITISCRTGLW